MKLHEIQQSAEDAVEKHETGKKKIQNLSDSLKAAMDNHSRLCAQMPSLRSHLQQAVADKERRASQIADSMERQSETYSGPEAPESCYDERIGTMREQIVALEIEIRKADARAEFLRGALIQAEREDAETTDQLKSYSCELDRIIRNYIQQRKPLSEAHSSGFGEHLRTLSEQFSKSQEKCMRLREKILKSLGTAADCVYPEPEKLSALHPGTGRGAKAARSTPGGCLPKSGTSTSGQAGQTKPYTNLAVSDSPCVSVIGEPRNGYTPTGWKGRVKVPSSVKRKTLPVVINRTVYRNDSLDPDLVIPPGKYGNLVITEPTTNLELMKQGKPPFLLEGTKESPEYARVELHHTQGNETNPSAAYFNNPYPDGSMVEISASAHDKYKSLLHIFYGKNTSFRNNEYEKAKYEAFRAAYWKSQAEMFLSGARKCSQTSTN